MDFKFSNEKPEWLDKSLKWRSDLWDIYVADSKSMEQKTWLYNISNLMKILAKNSKKERLEIVLVIYAITIDNIDIIYDIYKNFYNTLIERLIAFNVQTEYKYRDMFKKLEIYLKPQDMKYEQIENYEYNMGKFILVESY